MSRNFTYIDNSNVYAEGCRVSAVSKGFPGAATIIEVMNNKVVDYDWKIDYGFLHDFACGKDDQIGCANLWGSPPPSDTFWEMVKRKGFDVKTYDRNAAGKEKKLMLL
jgi:hypothetical protein